MSMLFLLPLFSFSSLSSCQCCFCCLYSHSHHCHPVNVVFAASILILIIIILSMLFLLPPFSFSSLSSCQCCFCCLHSHSHHYHHVNVFPVPGRPTGFKTIPGEEEGSVQVLWANMRCDRSSKVFVTDYILEICLEGPPNLPGCQRKCMFLNSVKANGS